MGFIQFLSKAGQRVYHFLIKGIQEGLSGTEIMKTLRERGLGYRLTDFYNDLRVLKGEISKWDTMKFVPKDKVISERLYTPVTTTYPAKFATVFRIEYMDEATGLKDVRYVTVNHDAPMRRNDLEEKAVDTFYTDLEGYEAYGLIRILRVIPERGFRRL
ncbi:MAG: hypothetical protein QW820_07010 [Sulfolobales archaeon]